MQRVEIARIRFASNDFQQLLGVAIGEVRRAFAMTRSPRPYVAFSGGKDSVATAAIVHYVRDDVPLIWSDDELEYPESVQFMDDIRCFAPGHFIAYRGVATHARWFKSWVDEPFFREPLEGTRIVPPTLYLREHLADVGYNLTFLGTRAQENSRRKSWFLQAGANYRVKGGTRSCPIAGWSSDDVWALIAGWGLAFNPAYAKFEKLRLPDVLWRVGPLPLVPRDTLAEGWPDLLEKLESRYGQRWV